MKIQFNNNKQPDPPHFYLGTPDHELLCPLNGIRPDSVNLTLSLNDTAELSFSYDRYILAPGQSSRGRVMSSGYDLLNDFMCIYVERIGWFIMSTPQISNDGDEEYKKVSAQSAEIGLTNNDLLGFKVNCGTTDSVEMLVPDNVEYIGDVPFAKKQVTFCDKEHPELSLLHMVLSFAGIEGWSIGHIDEIPKVYRSYKDGELVEEVVQLKDEIGTFDVDSKSVYSFLTQDVEQFFECLILFDIEKMTVNAFRPENLGKDTNVTVGFRNLQNANDISVDKNSVYTRYRVEGDDRLGIEYVNFGSNMIENLSSFLNENYMSEPLIAKYNAWRSDTESKRYEYMELSRSYNSQLNVMSELMDRLPLDDCSTEWNKFSDDNLLKARDNYEAQLKGYESYYVDDNGDFDEEKLKGSPDANDYYQIRDVILPSIAIEVENRKLPTSEGELPYIDSYKTDWKLYGISELLTSIDFYQSQKKSLEDAHYDIPYEDYAQNTEADEDAYPPHTRDMHEEMHSQYLDVVMQLNETISGSCANALAERTAAYEAAEALAEALQEQRTQLAYSVDKKNWKMEGTEPFTRKELRTLSRLYRDTDYTNNNMFLTSSDDQVTAIDEQLKLYDAAVQDLEISSQPQYVYATDLDNFLSMYKYRQYTDNLELGDFLYLGTQDDYVVKLRLISCSFNPLSMDNDLRIEFSNMVKTGSKRYDATYLLGLGGNTSKNRISGSAGSSSANEGVTLTTGLIQKLLSSTLFNNKVANAINQHFQALTGQMIVAKNLQAEMIRTSDIHAEDGFFQYLQSQLIAADKIVSDSAVIKQLDTLVSTIKNALIGSSSTETGIIIHLTADNAAIEEAFLKEVVAQYISVNDLKAGSINTNRINILSEDGSLSVIGNTETFRDRDGRVRLQLGEDADGNFSFIVYDAAGSGVIMDQDGIRASAIADGLIKNDMIAPSTIGSDKINWKEAGASLDQDGNPVWNSAQITVNGEGLDIRFASIIDDISRLGSTMEGVSSAIDAVEKSITDKVWRTDLVEITDEAGNTVSKSIVDLLVQHNISLSGITDTVKEVQTDTGTLAERMTEAEQDASSFRQTVTETYATKEQVQTTKSELTQRAGAIEASVTDLSGNISTLTTDMSGITQRVQDAEHGITSVQTKADGVETEIRNAKGDKATLKEKVDGITTSVQTVDGKVSEVVQTAKELSSTITRKQDAPPTSIRYIRDWLNGSSVDALSHWVECRVMAGGSNIAFSLTPEAYDQNGNNIEIDNLKAYTDDVLINLDDNDVPISSSFITAGSGKKYMQLDLGEVYPDIDKITVWHYYLDERIYNHKLEVSADGQDWYTLYDSRFSGGYAEKEEGRVYYISGSTIDTKLSSITQNIDEISLAVKGTGDSLDNLSQNMESLSEDVLKNKSEIQVALEGILNRVTSVEGKTAETELTANGWKALFAQIGMYDYPDIVTNVLMSVNGLEVSNPATGMKTVMTTEEFAGYYNNDEMFRLEKDLTKTERIEVRNGIDTTAIKMVPKTYTIDGVTFNALPFVKSGGTS